MSALSITDERMLADWFSDGIGLWALAEKYDLRLLQLEAWFSRPEIQDAIARLRRMYAARRECTILSTADMAVNTLYAMMYAEKATPEIRRRCAAQLVKAAEPRKARHRTSAAPPRQPPPPPDPVPVTPFTVHPPEFLPPPKDTAPATVAQRATAALTTVT